MPKTSVSQWDVIATNNTDINSISLGESQMTPSSVNNAFREMMAQIKAGAVLQTGASTIILKQSTAPTPTAEGEIWWDTDDDAIVVGNGTTQTRFSAGGGTTFSDSAFRVQDNGDATKQIAFEASGIASGQTRTITVPDASGTMMLAGQYPTAVSLEGLSLVAGDILYATAADTLVRLAKGSDGQVLTLASGVPTWATAAGGGLTLLGTLTTTSGTTQSLTGFATTYKYLVCLIKGVSFTSTVNLFLALSSNSGGSYGTAVKVGSVNILNAAGDNFSGAVTIYGGNFNGGPKVVVPASIRSAGADGVAATWAELTVTGLINGLQFSGGTFDAGSIEIYGAS